MINRFLTMTVIAGLPAGCGPSPADVEEIKKGQKEILAKLEALDKAVAQVKAAPAAAQRRRSIRTRSTRSRSATRP